MSWMNNITNPNSTTAPTTATGGDAMEGLILAAGLVKAKENYKRADEVAIAGLANKVNQ